MTWGRREKNWLAREQRRNRPRKIYRRMRVWDRQMIEWLLRGPHGRCPHIQRLHVERQRGDS